MHSRDGLSRPRNGRAGSAGARSVCCATTRRVVFFFFFQAEDGIRDKLVTGVQTCALPISSRPLNLPVPKSFRQAGALVVDDRQAVGQLEGFRHRQIQGPGGPWFGRRGSPGLVSVHRLGPSPGGSFFRLRRGDFWAEVLLARNAKDNRARAGLQLLLDKGPHRQDIRFAIARDIVTQEIGVAKVVVVLVQAISHAAKAAQRFEPLNDPRLDTVARAFQLFFLRAFAAEAFQLFVDGLFDLFGRVPWPRGHLYLKDGAQNQGLLLRSNVLGDLLLVDQLLVEPARFPTAENRSSQIHIGVTFRVDRRGQPGHVDAGQLDSVLDYRAALGGDPGSGDVGLWHLRSAFEPAAGLLHEVLCRGLVEVSDNRQASVAGRVVGLEKYLHVFQLGRLDVRVRTDHAGVVRMHGWKQKVEKAFFNDPIGLILDALPPLIAHDVLLVGEVGLVELVKQVAQAVRFEP